MLRVMRKVANSRMHRPLNHYSNGKRMFGQSSNPNEDVAMAGLAIVAAAGVTIAGAIGAVGLGVGMGISFFVRKNKEDRKPKLENSVGSDNKLKMG